jgi:predicted metalloenzyme YecM
LKPEVSKFAVLRKENIVRGRPVDVYELTPAWNYKQYKISAIELIGPKEGDVLSTGFEHAEFVLKNGFQDFLDKYPDLDWDTSIMNANEFPMIKLKLEEDMQVKFHLEPILEIIRKENLGK